MICACGDTLTEYVCSTCRTTERIEARAEGRGELHTENERLQRLVHEWTERAEKRLEHAEAAEKALAEAQRFREQDADIYEAAAAEALAKLTLLHAENERFRDPEYAAQMRNEGYRSGLQVGDIRAERLEAALAIAEEGLRVAEDLLRLVDEYDRQETGQPLPNGLASAIRAAVGPHGP